MLINKGSPKHLSDADIDLLDGNELDAWVAVAFFGWRWRDTQVMPPNEPVVAVPPMYSSAMTYAMQATRPDWRWSTVERGARLVTSVCVCTGGVTHKVSSSLCGLGPTDEQDYALTRCRAGLKLAARLARQMLDDRAD